MGIVAVKGNPEDRALIAQVVRLGPLLEDGLAAWQDRPSRHKEAPLRDAFVARHGANVAAEVFETLDTLFRTLEECRPANARDLSVGDEANAAGQVFRARIAPLSDQVYSRLIGRYLFENR